MIRQTKLMIRGACPARGLAIALFLAMTSVLIPLPFLFLVLPLFVFTIVRLRASPQREACLAARWPDQPGLRGPPA
jgi:integral membrane sensor domain MASE1